MEYGRSIKLNDKYDFLFDSTKNSLSIAKDTDNLEQAIKIILGTLQGEIILYPNFGVDYPQIIGRDIPLDFVADAIKTAVIRDPRVRTVNNVELERNGRTLDVNINISTTEDVSLDIRGDIIW